ncbi:MAG: hypothetical protein H6673_03190 [Anaerolineales bacterium]|nr:hypothetical protein [Anaerolineales bacterium]
MLTRIKTQPRRALIVMGLPAVVAVLYLTLVVLHTTHHNQGNVGALLDDTWIHVRFAEHLSDGKGLTYNEGVLTVGATSPLWVLSLAIPYTLFDPSIFSQVDIAIGLSAVWHVLSVIAISGFGLWATRRAWIGLATGLITAVTGRYIWMGLSGMEVTAFATLMIVTLWSHLDDTQHRRPLGWRTGLLLALANLARPEAYLLAALLFLDALVVIPLRDEGRGFGVIIGRVKASWRGLLAYGLLAGSYPLTTLVISGYPLPNTFRAKSELGHFLPTPHTFFWMTRVDHGLIFIVFAVIGTSWLLWQARQPHNISFLWGAWPPLFLLGVQLTGEDRYIVNHARYVAPIIPLVILVAIIGVWRLTQVKWLQTGQHWLPLGLTAILGIITFGNGLPSGAQVSNDVHQLRAMHVQAGLWVRDTLAPDETIALNDVGAITHISNRRVLDLEGLVSPEVIDATRDTERFTCDRDLELARIILKERPRFIGIFPWFYPCLSSWPNALQAYNVFEISGPTVIAGGEMIFFEPVWSAWPMQPSLPSDLNPIAAHFEQGIDLAGYTTKLVEDGLALTLWWHAHDRPAEDYHVFVHLVNAEGQLVVTDGVALQHDSEPQQQGFGKQFSTSWWRAGDIIRDEHRIVWDDLTLFEQSGLSLNVGIYRYPSGQRLQLQRGGDVVNLPLKLSPKSEAPYLIG